MATKKRVQPKKKRTPSAKKVAKPTRTFNPLHMEDLEPHRFEDLVRQLAYSFRPWRLLEPTGRLGDDEGVDIRGVEVVRESRSASEEEPEPDDDGVSVEDDREWRVQCKRYKRLNPKALGTIVDELIPNKSAVPHGIIVATACELSADAMSAFHARAAALGVVEHVLWTRSVLEDMLYRPENDHLLFAYFGISLQIRQRSRLAEVRHELTTKRKLRRALGLSAAEFTTVVPKNILLRDIDDEHFPCNAEGVREIPPAVADARWQDCQFERFVPDGIWVKRIMYSGWLRPDGTWDILQESGGPSGCMAGNLRHRAKKRTSSSIELPELSQECIALQKAVPTNEQTPIHEVRFVPYKHILEIDAIGDPLFQGVHIFCRFDGPEGPYAGSYLLAEKWHSEYSRQARKLQNERRRPLYEELRASSGECAAATQPVGGTKEPAQGSTS